MKTLPAREWLARCTAELHRQIQDDGVDLADLAQVASEMLEEPAYKALDPEAAAQAWARDHA